MQFTHACLLTGAVVFNFNMSITKKKLSEKCNFLVKRGSILCFSAVYSFLLFD